MTLADMVTKQFAIKEFNQAYQQDLATFGEDALEYKLQEARIAILEETAKLIIKNKVAASK